MTQQRKNDTVDLLPSLQAKIQVFADGLTPEETEQLRTLHSEAGAGLVPPSLQAFHAELPADEQLVLALAFRRPVAGAGAATGGEGAEVQGYMKPLYEGDYGWKGPPGTNPAYSQPGGSNISGRGAHFVGNLEWLGGKLLGGLDLVNPW